jgi:TolA-binding protein
MNRTGIRHLAALSAVAAALALAPAGAFAQAQGSKETTTSSAVKDMLGKLWARLRAATPRPQPVASATTVTAGLRGSEATESELKPYWRGDREQDPAARAERQALEKAQALADSGSYAEAAKAFDGFLQEHPKSPLAGNALFGAALARAALGDKARASAGFEELLKREPQHPLAKDAEQALAALR